MGSPLSLHVCIRLHEAFTRQYTTIVDNRSEVTDAPPCPSCIRSAPRVSQFSAGRAEIASISRSSFDKMVPFYVVEQSIRSCLCVHCYKAKLITVALYQLWPTLHHGDNSGSGCTCNCGFCSDGACRTFLPFATEKSVHGMGDLSDLLLCEKVFIYRGQDGKDVKAHRSACVSGHCPTCQRKQAAFFGCPRHQGTTDRRFPASTATLGACPSAMEGQPGRVKWSMFTSVDAEGRATDARRPAGPQAPDDDDGDWEPRVASDTSRPKKVNAWLRKRSQ